MGNLSIFIKGENVELLRFSEILVLAEGEVLVRVKEILPEVLTLGLMVFSGWGWIGSMSLAWNHFHDIFALSLISL